MLTKKAYIDVSECIGCGACVYACSTQALELVNEKAQLKIDPQTQLDWCTGKAACFDVCPAQAIEIK
ncbi:4Fe-4S_ferredoxin [Hexamita inflata]|uniref:4Fe-4S ferredoxin n=1 Tax=Hexamita inflata TaxID=28002 RepID=A0AA86TUS3_9EUKA|nr:4Fe-4S ferredoxin [Hexamita inflata]